MKKRKPSEDKRDFEVMQKQTKEFLNYQKLEEARKDTFLETSEEAQPS